ncbi:hypothetical protein CL617_03675 [archaeon]|nr:hypothetical protein [archaeon]|tara:strand:- start:6572 stop:7528 length:957 start_codon:yes stop_codon:yes gene_type:complete
MDDGFYSGKRVLITGADGFIGSHLTEKLVDLGASVSVYVHKEKLENIGHIENKLKEVIVGDVSDKETIDLIVKNKPQIIYHLAANNNVGYSIKNPLEVLNINFMGTINVLESIRLIKDKEDSDFEILVFPSTSEVYGKKEVAKESDFPDPRNPYADSKVSSEIFCRSYSLNYEVPVVVVRLFNVYGPRQGNNVVHIFTERALKNEDLKLDGGGLQGKDFIYIDDIIGGLLALGKSENVFGESFNFGSGTSSSIKELAETIKNLTNSQSNLIFSELRPGDSIVKQRLDISKSKNLLGWEPKISLEEGLRRTVEYYKSQQ